MNPGSSSVTQPVKIKIEGDEESYLQQEVSSNDFGGNLYAAVKLEVDETSQPSEPLMLADCSAIKTEEIFIITELPGEEADQPVSDTSGETSNLFKCYLCGVGKLFQDENALRLHLLTSHPQQKKYNCSECSEYRVNIVTFNQHFQRHDASLRPAKCNICSLRFASVNGLKQHEAEIHQLDNGRIKRSNQRRRRVCPVCKKDILKDIYDQHLQSEHSDAKLVCPTCQEEFYTKKKLRNHKLSVHGSAIQESKRKRKTEEEVFRCYMCKSEVLLDSHELLHQHLMNVHEKHTKYRCEDCNYSSKELIRFNNHLARHDPSKKPFKCNICLIRFIKARSLRYHEVSAHNVGGSKEDYNCTICHKQLASYRELSMHMKVHKIHNSMQNATQLETNVGERDEEEKDNPTNVDTLPLIKCYMCNITLDDEATLKQHLKKKHKIASKDSRFKCTKCDFTHTKPVAFNKHLQKHDPAANPFKCTYCTLQFTSMRYKRFHEIIKHGHTTTPQPSAANEGSMLRCYLCSTHTLLESKTALNRHLRSAHPTQTVYSCTQCEFTTGMKLAFNNHHAKHDPVSNYVEIHARMYCCPVCPKEFPTRARLMLHQRRLGHGDPENLEPKIITSAESTSLVESTSTSQKKSITYPCSTCRKKFANNCSRIRHECEVHGTKTFDEVKKSIACNELKCYLCRIHTTLPNKRLLLQHLRTTHTTFAKYYCRKCTYSTTKQDQYNDHLACHDPVKRKFKCNFCSRRFLTARYKQFHEISAHKKKTANVIKFEPIEETQQSNKTELTEEETFSHAHSSRSSKIALRVRNRLKCYQCDPVEQLGSRNALLRHLATVHPHQGSYQCGECSALFRSKTIFNQHVSRHDAGERPYKCCVCSLRFHSRNFKKRHEMLLHGISNGWKYDRHACASCGMKFPSDKKLKKHEIDAHAPLRKKYGCSICGKTFSFQSVLKMHKVSHFKASVEVTGNSKNPDIKTVVVHSKDTVKEGDPATSTAKCTIRCYLCNVAVNMEDEMALRAHLLNDHPQQEVYHCNECNMSLDGITTFNQHLQQHDANKFPHKCDICPQKFDEVKSKNQHEADMHQLNNGMPSNSKAETDTQDEGQTSSDDRQKLIPKCYLCTTPTVFRTKNAVALHLKTDHPIMKEYKCTECDFTSTSSLIFNNHQMKHDPDKPHKCSLCAMRFFIVKTKKYHEASEHGLKTGMLVHVCPGCGKKCMSKSDLSRHQGYSGCESTGSADLNNADESLQKKKPDVRKILTCYMCTTPQQFGTKYALSKHLKSHSTQFSYNCSKCDYTTIIKREFNNHQQKHDTSKMPHKCSICSERFFTDRTRKFHEAAQHNLKTGTFHPCPLCRKVFMYKGLLQQHRIDSLPCAQISSEEDGPKPRKSSHSSKTSDKSILTKNSKSNDEKATNGVQCKLWCYLCSKNISKSGNKSLREHLETDHSLPCVNRCKRCSYSAKKIDIFNNHCARHDARTRPYKCRSCSLRFLTARYRKYHELCVHKNTTTNSVFCCTQCDAKFTFKYSLQLHMIGDAHRAPRTANGSSALTICNVKQELPEIHNIKSENCSLNTNGRPRVTTNKIFTGKLYRCHLCIPNHILDSRESLLQHLATHPVQDIYRCNGCSFSVNLVTMFNQHLAQHVSDVLS